MPGAGAMRIRPLWWALALLLVTVALSMVPGAPPHGYGLLFCLWPLAHWFYYPERRRRLAWQVGGILLWLLAFPDPDLGFLGWVLWVPYLVSRECDDRAVWWKAALFFGFFRAFTGFYWLGNIHISAWLFVSLFSGINFVLCFEAVLRFARFLPFALRGAIGWMLFEWCHSWWFGGFPWLYAAHTQYRYPPLIQVAELFGVPALSFVMAYACLAIYRRRRTEIGVALALVLGVVGYGLFVPHAPSTRRGPGVLMIQTAVPYSVKVDGRSSDKILADLDRLTAEGLRAHPEAQLVVWPETMHVYPLVEDVRGLERYSQLWRPLLADIRSRARRYEKPFLYGINSFRDKRAYTRYRGHNAALLVDADGATRGLYHKQRLVPMGEEFLLRRFLPEKTADAIKDWLVRNVGFPSSSDLETGDRFVTLDAGPGLKCAMLICFEGLYPSDPRRALEVGSPDLLLHLVNNGWFGKVWEERQCVAAWVFRAVETRTPFLSCANGGITCAIDPAGRIYAELDKVMEPGFLYAEVPRRESPTLYMRGGRFALPVVLSLLALYFAFRRRFRFRGRSKKT